LPTRLLAIGDIHLGRATRRLPQGIDPARVGPEAALRQAVRTARRLQVSAVLLAGDVADQEHDLYHAHGILAEILGGLGTAGIPVLAVAGNHDHETLPRLARALPDLQILGRNGTWETVTVTGEGGPVDVLGWSFPGPHHAASPAADLPRLCGPTPTVGLLHADLDATGSRYAPVSRHELAAAGPVRWLLGHIHQPSLSPADDRPGYLGSLVGLHPGETGPRGPWLVEVDDSTIALRHLVQAPLRWQGLDVPIDTIAEPDEELAAHVADALRDLAARDAENLAEAEVVGVRVRLVGRTAGYAALARVATGLGQARFPVVSDEQTLFVDAIANDSEPLHDLDQLTRGDDLPGLLARELVAVRDGRAFDLVTELRTTLGRVDLQQAFVALGSPIEDHDDEAVRARTLRAGYRLLDDLLASREVPRGPA
jgi:DNA repair protein SbcD/Mre11